MESVRRVEDAGSSLGESFLQDDKMISEAKKSMVVGFIESSF